jgi:uncharacterized membrane protein
MAKTLLAVHIAGGSVALASMFLPILTRKGGTLHRTAGWVFVAGMTVVSVTAFILSATRVLTDPSPQGRQAGVFLFYVALLTASGVSGGIRVLRFKKRSEPHRQWWDLGLCGALTVVSLLAMAYGVSTGWLLLSAFSVVGLFTGGSQLAYWLRPPSHHMHWWFQHMGSMLGSCIAATTAFLVVNAGRLGADTFSLAVWLAPTVIGTPTIAVWTMHYRRKFGPTRAAAPSHGSVVGPNRIVSGGPG